MTAHDFVRSIPHLPWDSENQRPRPSNSVLWRWLEQGSILINGGTPKPKDDVVFPVTQLVFFPMGRKRTTYQ